jgi:hypothetical protein
MFELKENLYIDQNVSIEEFTLLVNGIFIFNDFHKYQKHDIVFCYEFLRNKLHATYLFLDKSEILISKKVTPLLNLSNEEGEQRLNALNNMKESNLCSGLLSRLKSLATEERENIISLLEFLNRQKELNNHNFPTQGIYVKSQINKGVPAYKLGELIDWLKNNFNLNSGHGLPLTDWAKSLSFPQEPSVQEKDSLYDGYIKKENLTKIMQFMIECSQDPSYQRKHITNNMKQAKIFKDEKVKELLEVSKKKGFSHIITKQEVKGISPTALGYLIDFIQND